MDSQVSVEMLDLRALDNHSRVEMLGLQSA